MFTRFTEAARRAFVRAGTLAIEAGRPVLDTDLLVLGLAEVRPFDLESFTATADDVRGRVPVDSGRDLLASLGIDVDEIRRRARVDADDPSLWRLRRVLLRVTLHGPLGSIPLSMHCRKVVEVALWKPGAVTGERLLWGLLADFSNGAAGLLHATGIDLRALAVEAHIPVAR
ncbi:Clp protease N-terminal domain-containing protein [Nonomuraea sp. NPDC050556]|uniref:Clp protease N-terminal domain-containing protein n=1 Tax=Nonomuraea sp. NPDC050556 TaxID=3364369 RepID=UPI0037BB8462